MISKDNINSEQLTASKADNAMWLDLESINEFKPVIDHKADILKWLVHNVNTLVQLLFRIIRGLCETLFIKTIKGHEKCSGLPIDVCYIGDGTNYNYLNELIFSGSPEFFEKGSVRWWRLNSRARELRDQVHLTIIDIDFILKLLPKGWIPRCPAMDYPTITDFQQMG